MHISVEIRYMEHGLNIEKNETITILRPGFESQVTWDQVLFNTGVAGRR